ncbi:MAG: cation diffusion facilitator family transporter, partial [Deltaproteobacteria bacterium]|nr:cation diffusion facilitator family transporter [Deltaproteobacteria bacterium]
LAGQMLVVAIFGLLVNVVTAFVLSGAGHDDLNFRSAFLHMVGDTMSSVAIVGGALVIRWTGWVWIDPVLSVLICVVILIWAWGLTRDSVRILLEEAPRDVKTAKVIAGVRGAFEEVADIDDVHVWTITSGMHAMTAYVELARELPLAEQSELAHRLRHFVADEFSIAHAVFQFEPRGDA